LEPLVRHWQTPLTLKDCRHYLGQLQVFCYPR
jgi:hypothetical protein